MQILLFSDFHNAMDFHCLSSTLLNLSDLDVVFTLGDISLSDLLAIKELFPKAPIYGVCGNHDGNTLLDLAGIPDIHGKTVEICGLRFAGFGGSVRYKQGLYTMFTQKESLDIAGSLPTADVLISHDRAFVGKRPNLSAEFAQNPHEGMAGLTFYLQKKKPFLHVHGHIHENKRYFCEGVDTLSVYGAALLAIVDRNITNYRLLAHF